jgi:hypothetical protein
MTQSIDPRSYGSDSQIAAQTRVLQIVVSAMLMGVVAFAVFVIVTEIGKAPQGTTLSYVAVGFGTLMTILHAVIPAVIERAALANQSIGSGAEAVVRVFFTRTIIACALLEGGAFMSLVAVLTEHQRWVLGVTAVLLVLMVMQFPSRTRIEQWLETRMMEREQNS